MDANRLRETLEVAIEQTDPSMGAAVLIPLVDSPEGPAVLLEVRALTLDVQPGEVCLPGRHIEYATFFGRTDEGEAPDHEQTSQLGRHRHAAYLD